MQILQADFFDAELPSLVDLVITSPPLTLLAREPLQAIITRLSSVLASTGWILLDMPAGHTAELVHLYEACHVMNLQWKWFILQEDMYVAGKTQSLYCITWKSRRVMQLRPPGGYPRRVQIVRSYPMSHQCEFCPDWIAVLIQEYSALRDVVLDPFCGTGTVPRVAKSLGRTGYGIDLRRTNEDWSFL